LRLGEAFRTSKPEKENDITMLPSSKESPMNRIGMCLTVLGLGLVISVVQAGGNAQRNSVGVGIDRSHKSPPTNTSKTGPTSSDKVDTSDKTIKTDKADKSDKTVHETKNKVTFPKVDKDGFKHDLITKNNVRTKHFDERNTDSKYFKKHGKKFKYEKDGEKKEAYCYPGLHHHHWEYRCWNSHYCCWFYWDPCTYCYYYWYPRCCCWAPVSCAPEYVPDYSGNAAYGQDAPVDDDIPPPPDDDGTP
jgi:hypothetical protein